MLSYLGTMLQLSLQYIFSCLLSTIQQYQDLKLNPFMKFVASVHVEVEVEVEVNLRPIVSRPVCPGIRSPSAIVSRPVCPGIRSPSGTRDQFFFLLEISFRQLRLFYFVAPSLTRGRVRNSAYSAYNISARTAWRTPFLVISLGYRSDRVKEIIFYCVERPLSSNGWFIIACSESFPSTGRLSQYVGLIIIWIAVLLLSNTVLDGRDWGYLWNFFLFQYWHSSWAEKVLSHIFLSVSLFGMHWIIETDLINSAWFV
jgi:hypothetical protein